MTGSDSRIRPSEQQLRRIQQFKDQGIVFRRATPEDGPVLADFHNTQFDTVRTREHWIWEYYTYAPEQSVFLLAEKDGRVLATQGFIPIQMRVGEKDLLAAKGENALCLAPYRGTGLQQALGNWGLSQGLDREFKINWSLSFINQLPGRFNFATTFFNIQVWSRPGNTRLEVTRRLGGNSSYWRSTPLWRRIGSTGKLVWNRLTDHRSRAVLQIKEVAGYTVEKNQVPYDDLMLLRGRMSDWNKNVVWIKYDETYLSWRIRGHPFLRYDEYQVRQEGVLRAYAFATEYEGEVCISDLLSENGYATSLLLSRIIEDHATKVGRFRFLGNPMDGLSQDLFAQLSQFGFSPSMKWHITMKDRVGDMGLAFYDVRNWHVNGLWTEGFLY